MKRKNPPQVFPKKKYTLEQAKELVSKGGGWKYEYGFSKKELGITTPKQLRTIKCGCVYYHESGGWIIKERCPDHQREFNIYNRLINKEGGDKK